MSYTKKTKLIRIFQVGLEKGWKNNFLKTKPLFIPPCLQCSFNLLFMFILLFSHFLFILVTLWRPKNLFLEIKVFIISYFYFKNSTFSLSQTSFFLSKFIPVLTFVFSILPFSYLRIQRIILLQFITNISNLIKRNRLNITVIYSI